VKLKLFPLVVIIALLALPAAAPAASTKKLHRQVVTLKAQVKRLKAANATLTAANTKLTTDLGTRTGERDAARSQLGTAQPAADRVPGLEADNARLVAENTGLKGNLPAQVAAVAKSDNIADLFNLVINPAFAAWACSGSKFIGQTFWSVDFNRRASDGSCF
jgi:regulator of replication initiation timing